VVGDELAFNAEGGLGDAWCSDNVGGNGSEAGEIPFGNVRGRGY
jgi:hypothetical protein